MNAPTMHPTPLEKELEIPESATLLLKHSIPWTPYLRPINPRQDSATSDSGTNKIQIPITPSTSIHSSTKFLLIGRQAATSDLRIDHKSISRKHATLYFLPSPSTATKNEEYQLILKDLGGKHGCHVNKIRMEKRQSAQLVDGDEVQFGNVKEQIFVVHMNMNSNMNSNDGKEKDEHKITGERQQEEKKTNDKKLVVGLEEEETQNNKEQELEEKLKSLTGRERREAEIAAMMASLEQTPTYTKSNITNDDNNLDDSATHQEVNKTNISQQQQLQQQKQNESDNSTISILAKQYKIPITSTLTLPPPTTTSSSSNNKNNSNKHILTSICLDPSGARLLTSSTDTTIRLYDFGGLNLSSLDRPFKIVHVQEGHPIVQSSFSNTGDRVIVGTTSAQPIVLDRDGREIVEFIKGDPYVTDMAKTTGHISSVRSVAWHPFEKDVALTCSTDGSARLWDIGRGKRQFSKLCCGSVYRAKTLSGKRVNSVTCVAFAPGGKEFVLGTDCGSLQVWKTGKVGTRPERVVYNAHQGCDEFGAICGKAVNSLVFNYDGTRLASRSMDDDCVKVWDFRRLSKSAVPTTICTGLTNGLYQYSNSAFSPDGRLLCAGTSVEPQSKHRKSRGEEYGILKMFRLSDNLQRGDSKSRENNNTIKPIVEIDVSLGVSVINVVWHAKLNQIFLGLSDGSVKICYDTKHSKKGALSCVSKGTRKEDDLSLLLASRAPQGGFTNTANIMTPHALPLFSDTERTTKRKRDKERHDPKKTKKPQPPATGIKVGEGTSANLNFTQFIASNTAHTKNIAGKDPREELFKYSTGKMNYTETRYDGDKRVLAEKTVEEEEEDMKNGK